MNGLASGLFCSLCIFLSLSTGHAQSCYDPAIVDGYAFKDENLKSLVVVNRKDGKTVLAGIGTFGRYYGCTFNEGTITTKARGKRKISLFMHIFPFVKKQDLSTDNTSIRGFEIDYSTEGRKVLAGRAIQVPWDIVNKTEGVEGRCGQSTPSAFEAFLYGILRSLKVRRCTPAELVNLIGDSPKQRL